LPALHSSRLRLRVPVGYYGCITVTVTARTFTAVAVCYIHIYVPDLVTRSILPPYILDTILVVHLTPGCYRCLPLVYGCCVYPQLPFTTVWFPVGCPPRLYVCYRCTTFTLRYLVGYLYLPPYGCYPLYAFDCDCCWLPLPRLVYLRYVVRTHGLLHRVPITTRLPGFGLPPMPTRYRADLVLPLPVLQFPMRSTCRLPVGIPHPAPYRAFTVYATVVYRPHYYLYIHVLPAVAFCTFGYLVTHGLLRLHGCARFMRVVMPHCHCCCGLSPCVCRTAVVTGSLLRGYTHAILHAFLHEPVLHTHHTHARYIFCRFYTARDTPSHHVVPGFTGSGSYRCPPVVVRLPRWVYVLLRAHHTVTTVTIAGLRVLRLDGLWFPGAFTRSGLVYGYTVPVPYGR